MAAEDQTITAKFIADTAGFDAGADDVIGKSQAIEASTSGMSKSMEEAGTAMSSFGGDAQKAGEGASAAAAGFKSMEESAGALSKDTEGAASGIAAVGTAGEAAAKGTEEAATGFAAVGKAGDEAGTGAKAAAGGIAEVGTSSSKAATESSAASTSIAAVGKSSEEAGSSSGRAASGFSLMATAMNVMMAIQFAQMVVQVVAAMAKVDDEARATATAFTYLTGSEQKAQQELSQLNNTWAAAKFGTQNIDNVAQHLLMSGTDAQTAQKEIERVSDALAAMGGSAQQIQPVIDKLHSIQGESKVTQQDMQELVNEGIPAWDALAEGMSNARGRLITVQEAQKEVNSGAISGKEAYQDMMTGMMQYTGAAEQSSHSLSAEWDRLGQNMAKALSPVIDELEKVLDGINSILEHSADLNTVIQTIGTAAQLFGGPFGGAQFIGHAEGIIDSPVGHFGMVGEDGPELMYIPQGSSIFPNGVNPFAGAGSGGGGMSLPSFLPMVSGGNSGPQTVELHIHMDSATIARQTIPLIAPQIRVLTGGRK